MSLGDTESLCICVFGLSSYSRNEHSFSAIAIPAIADGAETGAAEPARERVSDTAGRGGELGPLPRQALDLAAFGESAAVQNDRLGAGAQQAFGSMEKTVDDDVVVGIGVLAAARQQCRAGDILVEDVRRSETMARDPSQRAHFRTIQRG